MPANADPVRQVARTRILTDRLSLDPLTVDDAAPMAQVLSDPALHRYTGDRPPTVEELTHRYRAQVAGPPDPSPEVWGNWTVRLPDGTAIGFVQATIDPPAATLAWVIGVPHQRRGYATEAVRALVRELRAAGIQRLTAFIHPRNVASRRLAQKIGLAMPGPHHPFDGEDEWVSDEAPPLSVGGGPGVATADGDP